MFDDDTLMYPDCAEHLMRVYEADTRRLAAGVTPELVLAPPDAPAAAASTNGEKKDSQARPAERGENLSPTYNRFSAFVRSLLKADERFVPYDADYPNFKIPMELAPLGVGRRHHMQGARMTFRREVIEKEKFDEILEGYAAGEDLDATYRASRHGPLITCFPAKVCHLKAPGGRFSQFAIAALLAMNMAVLHRIYSTDARRSRKHYRRLIRRECLIHLVKDLRNRRWSLPNARGSFFALRHLDDAFSRDEAELRRWYPQFQREVIARSSRNGAVDVRTNARQVNSFP
jgi:hypothetical protein